MQALAVGVAYYVGAEIGFALTPRPQPVSTLWPPNALLLGALLLTPVRSWPLMLLAALPAHLAVELRAGVPVLMVLSWFMSNCSEALIGAACIRRLIDGPVRLDSFRRVGVFVAFGAMLAPFLSSFLDAAFVRWNEWGAGTYWEVWRGRFFSNVLAILALVPVIVAWGNEGVGWLRSVSSRRVLEVSLLLSGLLLVCTVVFAGSAGELEATPALLYAPLPFLLWAAVRFGPAGTSACLLIFALLSVWGAINGRGPFVDRTVSENVRSLQLFLIVTYIPLIGLTAVIRERERAEDEARQNEQRLNLALSAAHVSTWDWDIVSEHARWSGKTKEILGPDGVLPDFARGDFLDVVVPEDRPLVEAALARAIEDGAPYETEFRITRADGTIRWVLGKGTVVRDASGRPVRMLGVNADVTDRKVVEAALRAEATLRESEARLRELADAMPQIVFAARPDGQIDYFNRKWYELTDIAPNIVEGAGWLSIVHPDDRDGCLEAWLANVRAGRPHEHECRFWSARTRTYRWHLARALPVHDASGAIVRWYGTATDIDDRRRAEQALRESEGKLRAFGEELERRVAERTAELLLANATLRDEIDVRVRTERALRASEERFAKAFRASPDAISIARQPEARLVEINERWEAMFGYTRDEAIGRTIEDLRIFPNRQDGEQFSALMQSQGYVRELELDLQDKGGALLRGVLAAETVDLGGEPCLVTMIRDITERRRAEREIETQRQALAHLGRVTLLGELSGALAHELNQPLAAILANARAAHHMLAHGEVDATQIRAILDDIVADDRRAAAVIRRLRALIRKGDAELQPVVANVVVADVLDLAHSDLARRAVPVTTRLSPSLPPISADHVQLQQVILNLIMNACDAMADTPPDERGLVITTADEDDAILVTVADRGTGIAAESVDMVFEPFVTSKEHGLGLGLAICRSIVEAHGGRMWATNNEGRGATFYVRLPHAPVPGDVGAVPAAPT